METEKERAIFESEIRDFFAERDIHLSKEVLSAFAQATLACVGTLSLPVEWKVKTGIIDAFFILCTKIQPSLAHEDFVTMVHRISHRVMERIAAKKGGEEDVNVLSIIMDGGEGVLH